MRDLRLEVRSEVVQGQPIVRARGEIDIYTVPQFKQQLLEWIEKGHRRLLIDLTEVTYMDSSGFGALLGAIKRVRPEGGSISLINPNDVIRRMLKITHLDTIFPVYASEEEALQSVLP